MKLSLLITYNIKIDKEPVEAWRQRKPRVNDDVLHEVLLITEVITRLIKQTRGWDKGNWVERLGWRDREGSRDDTEEAEGDQEMEAEELKKEREMIEDVEETEKMEVGRNWRRGDWRDRSWGDRRELSTEDSMDTECIMVEVEENLGGRRDDVGWETEMRLRRLSVEENEEMEVGMERENGDGDRGRLRRIWEIEVEETSEPVMTEEIEVLDDPDRLK
jgi:hypothetical protein